LSSQMTMFIPLLYISLFKTGYFFPIVYWIKPIFLHIYYKIFINLGYSLSLALIKIVLCNWMSLKPVSHTSFPNPNLQVVDHITYALNCISPILFRVNFMPIFSLRIFLFLMDWINLINQE
jgi:hypothetical protein